MKYRKFFLSAKISIVESGSLNVIANPCTHWATPTVTWEHITLYKGILKEKTLSQVKSGSWSYNIYSLPEGSFLLSEFGAVLTYIHAITKHCFPRGRNLSRWKLNTK